MTRNLYVDIHILQDLPPSNINRDDSGTPKHAIYGGVTRLRASSQSWKRATRLAFMETMGRGDLGVRTRRFVSILSDELTGAGVEEEVAGRLATAAANSLGITASKKDTDLSYLLFFGRPQLREIAGLILDHVDAWADLDAKALAEETKALGVTEILGRGHPLDVALFGRMVADLNGLNVDAATQVAHAISTHSAGTEFDYFTAVDDHPTAEMKAGAAMIGMVEFNSATLYRYATVGVGQLLENLGEVEATVSGIGDFIEAFTLSMPAGHKNSFAPRTRPGLVVVALREDQPVNFVSAFEKPIVGGTSGTLEPSMSKLASFAIDEAQRWGDAPSDVIGCYRPTDGGTGENLVRAFGESVSLDELVSRVRATVGLWLRNE